MRGRCDITETGNAPANLEYNTHDLKFANVAKLVDALDLGSSGETLESSSLSIRTKHHPYLSVEVINPHTRPAFSGWRPRSFVPIFEVYMQVSVEATTELSRKMTVQISEESIQEKINARLNIMARQARIDGFRPGKVPLNVLKKRVGGKIREEILSDMIQTTFQDALRSERLNPAGPPQIDVSKADEGEGLEYQALFEVLPDFVVIPLESLEVKRFVSEVTDVDVADMLQRLRQQRGTWNEVERPAAEGDQVTISFEGFANEEPITNGKTVNFLLVLGSKTMIPGFEEQLIGASEGTKLEFELIFPSWYPNPKFANVLGRFVVEVEKVQKLSVPELDEEFAKSFGIEEGGIEAFVADVRENMERQMLKGLQIRNRNSVMDELYDKNMIALPSALVENELKDVIASYRKSLDKNRPQPNEATLKTTYTPLAKRRVALALILNKIVHAYQLKNDPRKVRATIEELAVSYQEPEDIVRWYYAEPSRLKEIENLVMEMQVVDLVFKKARVTEENISFLALTKPLMDSATGSSASA